MLKVDCGTNKLQQVIYCHLWYHKSPFCGWTSTFIFLAHVNMDPCPKMFIHLSKYTTFIQSTFDAWKLPLENIYAYLFPILWGMQPISLALKKLERLARSWNNLWLLLMTPYILQQQYDIWVAAQKLWSRSQNCHNPTENGESGWTWHLSSLFPSIGTNTVCYTLRL